MKKIISCIAYIGLPLLAGVLLLFGCLHFKVKMNFEGMSDVLNSIITFTSIVIGFYTAMYGVLITLENSDFFKRLRSNKADSVFKGQLYLSLGTAFITLILSIYLQGVSKYPFNLRHFFFLLWIFLIGFLFMTSFQSISLLLRVVFNHTQIRNETSDQNLSPNEKKKLRKKMNSQKDIKK